MLILKDIDFIHLKIQHYLSRFKIFIFFDFLPEAKSMKIFALTRNLYDESVSSEHLNEMDEYSKHF